MIFSRLYYYLRVAAVVIFIHYYTYNVPTELLTFVHDLPHLRIDYNFIIIFLLPINTKSFVLEKRKSTTVFSVQTRVVIVTMDIPHNEFFTTHCICPCRRSSCIRSDAYITARVIRWCTCTIELRTFEIPQGDARRRHMWWYIDYFSIFSANKISSYGLRRSKRHCVHNIPVHATI